MRRITLQKKNSLVQDFKKYSLKKFAVDNVYFVIGCLLYSLGVNIFAIPNKIAQSGTICSRSVRSALRDFC